MDAYGKNQILLVEWNGITIADNAWSPDGKMLAYVGLIPNKNFKHDIFLVIFQGE